MVRMTVGLRLRFSAFVICGLGPRIHAEMPHVSFAKSKCKVNESQELPDLCRSLEFSPLLTGKSKKAQTGLARAAAQVGPHGRV
jgi:hypothetical protein